MTFPETVLTRAKGFGKPSGASSTLSDFPRSVLPPERMGNTFLPVMEFYFHDLRGSLTSMLAVLKLVIRGYYGMVDEKIQIPLEELLRKGKELVSMTEEYHSMVFSIHRGMGEGREALNIEEDIFQPIIEEVTDEMRRRGIRFSKRCNGVPNPRLAIRGGKLWLRAVFRNLMKNAISYGELGGVIAIRWQLSGSMYLLSVYNSGNPVPRERRENLFSSRNPFEHPQDGTAGLGLGLYLSRLIVRGYGGDIRYEAEEHGSKFILSLPVETVE